VEEAIEPTRHFSKEDINLVNRYVKTMLDIINHQRKVNPNHNEELPQSTENGYYQKDKIKQVSERMCERGHYIHYWWECKLVQPLWKTFVEVPQKKLKYSAALFL
jgi:hypothetical protein